MPVNAALRDHLKTRRSVGIGFLQEPGPDEAVLAEMLAIATRVPDHRKLAPWRLVLYRGAARAQVGDKLAEIARRRNPDIDEASLDAERQRFLPAPLTVGVLSVPVEDPKVPEIEQVLSAGNVCFNLLHAAAAFGFGASWVTRWYTFDAEAAATLGAGEGERFVGFVHIGTATAVIEDRDRPQLSDVVREWGVDRAYG
ncbi:nitroreductase [Devosia albogilva]|uniref:Putative NAD(P)H nitroreductase n=1 Tax=Devosia albogilva TaxID=429726 RepID=A0ABW5QFC1_9HYPH